jgi:hypothetical protein
LLLKYVQELLQRELSGCWGLHQQKCVLRSPSSRVALSAHAALLMDDTVGMPLLGCLCSAVLGSWSIAYVELAAEVCSGLLLKELSGC